MDTPPPPKLLDQLRDALRLKHYAYRTEQTYVGWAERYIRFHQLRHPREMGVPEITAFLTHWNPATIFAPCKNSSATPMSKRP